MIGLTIAGALAEVVSLGALVPFLAAIASPSRIMENTWVSAAMDLLNLDDSSALLLALTVFFVVAVLAAAVVRLILVWATNKYVFMVGHDLSTRLYNRMLHQPYSFYAQTNTSEIISSIQKVQQVIFNMLRPLMQSISSVLISAFIVGTLIWINPVISITAFLGFGLTYLGTWQFTKARLKANGRITAQSHSAQVKTVQEGLGGIRDVLLDGSQPVFLERFRRFDKQFRDAQTTNNFISAAPRFVVEASGMVLIALLALALATSDDGIVGALPVLGALALGAQRLLPMIQQIFASATGIAGYAAMTEDVLDKAEAPLPAEWLNPPGSPLPFEREITFRNVSFRYDAGSRPAVNGLNFSIPKGARIGIVGKTGSGKSTTIDLLMGLLEPTAGCIEIDGQRLDATTRRAWQRQIAHVPQSIFLADASVAENIAFGIAPEVIDHQRVRSAAQRAEIADYIESLPEDYRTEIGERGVRLSGGQRQRIGIARALYRGATLLVLDEATSALDTETESAVMVEIERLDANLTIVIVAHRLSTIEFCDQKIELRLEFT